MDKKVSSSGNTTRVPSDSVDISDIDTLKVQLVGPVMDEDAIKL